MKKNIASVVGVLSVLALVIFMNNCGKIEDDGTRSSTPYTLLILSSKWSL